MANRKNFANRVEARKAQALARQVVRDNRSAKEQLTLLDKRLGKGIGATQERARLETIK